MIECFKFSNIRIFNIIFIMIKMFLIDLFLISIKDKKSMFKLKGVIK